MLGRGANCALLDALSLAEVVNSPSIITSYMRSLKLRRVVDENVDRRIRERRKGALLQGMVYLGDNRLEEFCRNHGLKAALGWLRDPKESTSTSA